VTLHPIRLLKRFVRRITASTAGSVTLHPIRLLKRLLFWRASSTAGGEVSGCFLFSIIKWGWLKTHM